MNVKYGANYWSVDQVFGLANGLSTGYLEESAVNRITECRNNVERIEHSHQTVYGINTGFGPLCDTKIKPDQTSKLQENLLISHAVVLEHQ